MRLAVLMFAVRTEAGVAKAGIGRYALKVVGEIARQRPKWRIDVFVARGFVPPPDWIAAGNVRTIPLYPMRLFKLARFWPANAWFLPCYDLPPTPAPRIATMHDLFPITHPEWFAHHAESHALAITNAARACDAFVCVSEDTRREMERVFGVTGERSVAIPHGPGSDAPVPPGGLSDKLRERYGIPGRYFFAISTLEPRKNFPRLIEAFARIRRDIPDLRLAIAGGRGWGTDEVEAAIREHDLVEAVRLLGYVEDEELAALYGSCEAVVCPSLSEGFGLPVLEAMRAGAPVLSSDRGSLPEVGGDAVRYFDPESVDQIETALRAAIDDPSREEWRERGRLRAEEFTWERSGRLHAEFIERVAKR